MGNINIKFFLKNFVDKEFMQMKEKKDCNRNIFYILKKNDGARYYF